MVCYDPYVKIILIFSVIVSIVRVVNSQDIVILRWLKLEIEMIEKFVRKNIKFLSLQEIITLPFLLKHHA